jgi:transposase
VELTPLVVRLREVLKQHNVLHADETPVSMLSPGKKRTHRAYVWAYATTRYAKVQGVVYDFRASRAGKEVRTFLQDWHGKLVCDDYSGYKASFAQGITEIGCTAHARRKFHDLYVANQSPIAQQALQTISLLYDIERELSQADDQTRLRLRQEQSRPVLDKLRHWLIGQREQVTDGTGTAKAVDHSLKRWQALARYLDDGAVPIDNNWVENQIRPWALGRSNWLFAGSLRSGQRAANIMTLIQSAKINGIDPQAYLKNVLERLPVIKYSELDLLLPHHWKRTVNMV